MVVSKWIKSVELESNKTINQAKRDKPQTESKKFTWNEEYKKADNFLLQLNLVYKVNAVKFGAEILHKQMGCLWIVNCEILMKELIKGNERNLMMVGFEGLMLSL